MALESMDIMHFALAVIEMGKKKKKKMRGIGAMINCNFKMRFIQFISFFFMWDVRNL